MSNGKNRARLRVRPPTTPRVLLNEEFLKPLGISQTRRANYLGCDVKVVNRLVNDRTSVSAEMALKLGSTFRTSAEFWLNPQKAVDLHAARAHIRRLPLPLLAAG